MENRCARGIWAVVAAAALGIVSARAQTTSSVLTGTLRVQKGSPVPGALVQARSQATGALRSTVTDREGRYRIDLLAPGTWTVVARLEDGTMSETRTVTLRLQETVTLDFTVGSALMERVTVVSSEPLVDPARTGGEFRIGGSEVDALPLAGRVVTDLALLDSSVRATPPGDFYGERGSVFVVNGQSGRSNSFLVDGLDNNDRTSGTTLNAFFSQQVIQEFSVLTSQYAPEFGRASGGILNIITQRGGNQRSGGGFVQGVTSGLGSTGSFVSSLPNPDGVQDTTGRLEAGLKFSGPIRPDRSAWFLAYEHQESDDVIPYTGLTRNRVAGGRMLAPSRDDNFFLRGDFDLFSGHSLMVRLSGDDRATQGLNVGGITTPEAGFQLGERDLQLAVALTSIITPELMNEERVLVGYSSFDQSADSDRPGVERPSGVFGGNNLNHQFREEVRVQWVDNLTLQKGPHTLKLGTDLGRSVTRIQTRFNPNGNFLYDTDLPFEPGDCGDLLASQVDPSHPFAPIPCPGIPGVDDDGDGVIDEPGVIGTYPVVFQLIEGQPAADLDDKPIALFAQDTWQAGSKLLLNYGLRYDLSTFRLPEKTKVPSSIPNGGAPPDRDNVAPRLGFTFMPTAGGRFVVRGGAGVFYDKLVLGFPAVAAITSGTQIGLTFPQGFTFEVTEAQVEQFGIDAIKQVLFFPQQLILRFSTGTRLDTPYTDQYNLGAEWGVGRHGALQANVTRALGYHQALLRDLNPVIGTDAQGIPRHPDPTVGSIAAFVTEGRSWYSGLDLGWRWRGADSWYSVSYTLSKALDLGPDPLKGGISLPPNSDDIPGEKGRTDADRRHRFVLSGISRLPWLGMKASGVVQWSSGAPFNVTTGRDENLDGITSDRPPGVGRNTGADTPLGPVNALRTASGLPVIRSLVEPAFFQTDLKIWKPFSFKGDKSTGEMFLQVFNLLDRFNGGPVEGRVTSRAFGRPIGLVGPPRTLEVGMKFGF